VINDENFLIRNAFEQWHQFINSPEGNLRSAAAPNVDTGYGVDAYVDQYGKAGQIIKSYTFFGMFPVDIAPIDLNWGSNDAIEEFGVTLAYQYWTAQASNGADIQPVL
jgi:hypothetical protein